MKFKIILLIISVIYPFDGFSVGYDGNQFQSATFHKKN